MSSILNSHNVSQKIINKLSGAMWQLFVATTHDFLRYVANTRMIFIESALWSDLVS